MNDIKDIITEKEDIPLLFDCIQKEIKRCKGIANRPLQGYGSGDEQEKKKAWLNKAEELQDLQNRISACYI